MLIINTLSDLRAWRKEQESVAFVPTMGNLHKGHLSLVKAAFEHCPTVIVSIFVNPLQFGKNEDLDAYPRTFEQDCEYLKALGVQAVFSPKADTIYPDGMERHTVVSVPNLPDHHCGDSRPGHFDGVSTIVCKLFGMVQPDVAVFGEKDFQQLAIIRKMTEDLCLPIRILSAPIYREADGLAMSSRNGYLSQHERTIAPKLFEHLNQLKNSLLTNTPLEAALTAFNQAITQSGFSPDYCNLANATTLEPDATLSKSHPQVLLVAAFLGKTRLIDNIELPFPHN